MTQDTERYARSILAELKSALPQLAESGLAKIMLREIGKLDPAVTAEDISRIMCEMPQRAA